MVGTRSTTGKAGRVDWWLTGNVSGNRQSDSCYRDRALDALKSDKGGHSKTGKDSTCSKVECLTLPAWPCSSSSNACLTSVTSESSCAMLPTMARNAICRSATCCMVRRTHAKQHAETDKACLTASKAFLGSIQHGIRCRSDWTAIGSCAWTSKMPRPGVRCLSQLQH